MLNLTYVPIARHGIPLQHGFETVKEAKFFDYPALAEHDVTSYEAMFETTLRQGGQSRNSSDLVLADFSPAYMWVPYVPCRIAKLWPGAKLIFLLR